LEGKLLLWLEPETLFRMLQNLGNILQPCEYGKGNASSSLTTLLMMTNG
jgi:hypothetical protein